MDKAIKKAILREAAKLYSPTPTIVDKETAGVKMFALTFVVDGHKEMLTAWHSNPLRLIDAIRAQIKYCEESAAMFPDKGTEYQAQLIAANID